MKNRNWFWGIFFLLAAVFVVASQTSAFASLSVMTLLATVLLAGILFKSLQERNAFGVCLSLALLYVIFREPLGWPFISPWLLVLAAAMAGIGFSLLFPSQRFHGSFGHEHWDRREAPAENMDDNHPKARVSFGASVKYLHADQLESAEFSVSFGAMEVYMDQAVLSPMGAVVMVDCSFGALKLYVPKHWRVLEELHTSLGGVDNHTAYARPEADAPVLTLRGNVQFSGIEIRYV